MGLYMVDIKQFFKVIGANDLVSILEGFCMISSERINKAGALQIWYACNYNTSGVA